MSKPPLLSLCIPTYEMGGKGHVFFKESLEIILTQTFKDFEVVVSDFSADRKIKELCNEYSNKLDIRYFTNTDTEVSMSSNTNNAMAHATGKLIKILFQDDYLHDEHSLKKTIDAFDLKKDNWLVSACIHTKDGKELFRPHEARYNKNVYLGKNTIGSPSVLTVKNEGHFTLDRNLKWLVDCDLYRKYFDAYGDPNILDDITVVIRTGDHQITNTEATEKLRKAEHDYVLKKYKHQKKHKLQLPNVSLVAVTGLNPTGAVRALEISIRGIDFGEAVLVAHYKPDNLDERITFKQCKDDELQSQDPKNTDDYSKFMLYKLTNYINKDYCLIVHNDAYVLRPEKWTHDFLKYDYLGAPWPINAHFTNEGVNVRIGNGGFALRSRKMLNALNVLKLPFTDNGTGFYHEDGVICVYHRKALEDYGIKFPPVDLASRFAREIDCPDSYAKPFGFHNNKKAISIWAYLGEKVRLLITKGRLT